MALYYGDIVLTEPELLHLYDELLAQIDRALAESPASPAGGRKSD
jgi:hypothetical protein